MGEKYQLLFLSSLDNRNILVNASNVLSKFGWYYNRFSLGKHSFWSDGPVWNFGNSKEVTEQETEKSENMYKLMEIIEYISQFYSQSITYHKPVSGRVTQAIFSIVESANLQWKEIRISFELNDLLIPNGNRDIISKEIKEIFIDLSTCLRPFYGKSAIETKGLVDEPKQLIILESDLGDFNYFSFECPGLTQFSNNTEKYEINDFENVGRFIFTCKHIGEYT